MIISTKGRYALQIMIDLAQHESDGYISLKSIAQRQDISMKYLEMIVSILNKAGLVKSTRGKDGGYMLAKSPEEYTLQSILKLSEGSLAPVACLDCSENSCDRADSCLTMPVWQKLDRMIADYLESITLADLISGESLK